MVQSARLVETAKTAMRQIGFQQDRKLQIERKLMALISMERVDDLQWPDHEGTSKGPSEAWPTPRPGAKGDRGTGEDGGDGDPEDGDVEPNGEDGKANIAEESREDEDDAPRKTWEDWGRKMMKLISEGKEAGINPTILVHAKARLRQQRRLMTERDEAASELNRLVEQGTGRNRKKYARDLERGLQQLLRSERSLGVDYIFEG